VALLSLQNITLSFGGPPIFDGITLQIEQGERLCLMGRNGTGKSTLLRLLAGDLQPESGQIQRQQGVRIAAVAQEAPPGLSGTVFDIVAAGMGDAARLLSDYHHLAHRMATESSAALLEELEELQHKLEESGGWSLNQEVERILKRLTLDADAEFTVLSGGTKRRVLLARALISSPDILILDEPTNHLDIDTIIWLEEFLLKSIKTLVFVTHDRSFARRIANRVAELDRGRIYAFSCGYDQFVERREALLDAEITRQALFDKKLAQEEVWVRQGIKARRTRNEGRVRALKGLREEYRQRRERQGTVKIKVQEAQRSGALVAEAENVSFAFGDKTIVSNFSTTVMRGDRIGIIGPNGSGKTTLIRLLLGELQPQSGEIKLGTRRELLYFDQLREQLDLDATVQENVGEGNDTVTVGGRQRHIIGYLQDFLFSPERARTPVHILSGGERNRLLLAKLFTKPSNLLVMDEPTNDLDSETLELLEDMLAEYTGTLLLVSHDREFLNNVVTSTLVLEGDGKVAEYVGGYDDWLRQRTLTNASAAGGAAARGREKQPEKTAARKLTFKEERELETLPDRIAALEAEQTTLHARLADPGFYKSAGTETAVINSRLAELEQELATVYDRWEELESLKG
jgi:ATP-binding cassette subfamily F protein uup